MHNYLELNQSHNMTDLHPENELLLKVSDKKSK